MGFHLKKGYNQAQPMRCGASSTIVVDDLCVYDRANALVIPATAALLTENVAGVAQNTPAAADTEVSILPIVPGQLWEWDTTNNTAVTHLNLRHVLTNAQTVANTVTDQAVDEVVVTAIENSGAAAARLQRGYINLVPATLS